MTNDAMRADEAVHLNKGRGMEQSREKHAGKAARYKASASTYLFRVLLGPFRCLRYTRLTSQCPPVTRTVNENALTSRQDDSLAENRDIRAIGLLQSHLPKHTTAHNRTTTSILPAPPQLCVLPNFYFYLQIDHGFLIDARHFLMPSDRHAAPGVKDSAFNRNGVEGKSTSYCR